MLNKNTLGIKCARPIRNSVVNHVGTCTLKQVTYHRPFKLLERNTIVNSILSQSMIGFVTWFITTVTIMQLK